MNQPSACRLEMVREAQEDPVGLCFDLAEVEVAADNLADANVALRPEGELGSEVEVAVSPDLAPLTE